jgi:general stress protein YciG
MATTGKDNPGNFANDPERASEAGQKGGEHSHGGGRQSNDASPSSGGGQGNSRGGNFANDKEKASEAGKKGGQKSGGSGGGRKS